MTKRIMGIGAAPGIAIGKVVIRRPETTAAPETGSVSPEVERGRLASAVESTRGQLRDLADTIAARAGVEEANIFKAHLALLDDPLLIGEIARHIATECMSAEQAVSRAASAIAERFDALEDAYLRERAADVRDLGQRLLMNLSGASGIETGTPRDGILVSRSMTPSETALIDAGRILAVVTEEGSGMGHAAILARALNLVAVFGAKGILTEAADGDWLVVDGTSGELLLRPDTDTIEGFRQRMDAERVERGRLSSLRDLPAVTSDGFRIALFANIAGPSEAGQALAAGAEGIGVFRTEYLFVNRAAPPGEEEQCKAYRELLSKMALRRVVVRTMDIGGDKDVACWPLPAESNPALGMRGIRLSLVREEDFRCQLRALARAAAGGNLSILLPMISDITEVRRTRELLEWVRRELVAEGRPVPDPIPLGVMVETPAAAILLEDLADEADFFSIGTNDLVQYVLAADRTGDSAGAWYQPYHPAVLRLMQQVARTAHACGKHVAVCGEMAADPLAAPLFIGMAIDELSMNPPAIPAVKDAIRGITKIAADALLEDVLKLSTAAEIVERLQAFQESAGRAG
jgi:phosphoenolpyruvate-protein phosphotransferase (PTS system enzyme I)